MIIDTHTHIYLNKKKSQEEILSWLKDDNIKKIISIGIDLKTSQTSIDLARQNKGIVYATVGIHPTDVWQYKHDLKWTINQLERMILDNIEYVKWVWECGFDFHWINAEHFEEEKQVQEEFFKAQIELAKKYSLPIIIHTRKAKDETLRVLKEMDAKKFVLHCFSEDLDFAFKAIYYSEECKVSFSGIVTYKTAHDVQKTAANIPLDRILVETDCPFLPPQPVRWQENLPNNTKYNLEKVFELRQENGKNETFEQVEKQVFENSIQFFNLV